MYCRTLYCLQAESYRTLAQQSEEKRARAEDELLTTARLASSLEARLAAAARDNEDLRLEVQVRRGVGHPGVGHPVGCSLQACLLVWLAGWLAASPGCVHRPGCVPCWLLVSGTGRHGVVWRCLPTACLQAAAVRVIEAQQSVARLVQQRWEAAGADRAAWPLAAQVRHLRAEGSVGHFSKQGSGVHQAAAACCCCCCLPACLLASQPASLPA